jgi:hypothetical protein
MDFNANPELKVVRLNQAYNFLLMANSTREVTILHNPYNFVRTLLHPTDKVGCLVRKGPSVFPVIINHQGALCLIQVTFPPARDITNCLTVNNLATLLTPTPTCCSLSNLEGLSSFFPAPFLSMRSLQRTQPPPMPSYLQAERLKRSTSVSMAGTRVSTRGLSMLTLNCSPFGPLESTKDKWKRVVSPLPPTTKNSRHGAPTSTASTSFQALNQRSQFLPPRQTPRNSSDPLLLASLAPPRRPSTRIKPNTNN